MILECPSCSTRYEVPAAVPPQGRKVRCAKCGHVWLAMPPPAEAGPEPVAPRAVASEPTAPVEDTEIVFQDAAPELPENEPPENEPLETGQDAAAPEETELQQPELQEARPEQAAEPLEAAPEEIEPQQHPVLEEAEPEQVAEPFEAEPEETDLPQPESPEPPPPAGMSGDAPGSSPSQEDAFLEEEDWGYDPEPPVARTLEGFPAGGRNDRRAGALRAAAQASQHARRETEEGESEEEDDLPLPAAEEDDDDTISIAAVRRPARVAPVAAGWGALLLLLLAIAGGAYAFRVDVVRALPATARLYAVLGLPVNTRGLEFEDVSYAWAVDDGRLILEVRGQVVNVTAEPLIVPTVTFNLRNEKDAQVFQWIADIRTEPLAAQDRARFVARIPSPPKTVRSLQVHFADGA